MKFQLPHNVDFLSQTRKCEMALSALFYDRQETTTNSCCRTGHFHSDYTVRSKRIVYWQRRRLITARTEAPIEVQTGMSQNRFLMVPLEFFIDIILQAALMALGSTQPLTEMSTSNISWGVKAAGA
jgi:hypothetical protein